jgi:hypothetical protein
MPLVRISLAKGKPATYRRQVGDAVRNGAASYAPAEQAA